MEYCVEIEPVYISHKLRPYEKELFRVANEVYIRWRIMALNTKVKEFGCGDTGCVIFAKVMDRFEIDGESVDVVLSLFVDTNRMFLSGITIRTDNEHAYYRVYNKKCQE